MGKYVCVLCVWVFFFILIESGRVIPRTVMPVRLQTSGSQKPQGARRASLCDCKNSHVLVWVTGFVFVCTVVTDVLPGVCVCVCTCGWVETTGGCMRVRTAGSLCCNELYWFCRQHSKSVCCNIIKRKLYTIAGFNEDNSSPHNLLKCRSRASKQDDAV